MQEKKWLPANVVISNITIPTVAKQGVIFERTYSWKEHIAYIKKSLIPRVNMIKYLATKRLKGWLQVK